MKIIDCNTCCHLDLKVYITLLSATKLPREEEAVAAATKEATEEVAIVGRDEDVNVSADLFAGVLLGRYF